MIDQLLRILKELATRVKKNSAVNVNSQHIKQQAIDVGTAYFRDYRQHVLATLGNTDALQKYDQDWQQLIRPAHGNSPKKSYAALLRRLVKATTEINVAVYSTAIDPPAVEPQKISYSDAERILIETLDSFLPTAAASYRQGIADLSSAEPRYSYRGAAAKFREAFRETLNHLAPDSDAMNESWYKPEKDQTGPTMRQKVRVILSSRGKNRTQHVAAEKTVELIETLSGEVARAVYNRASLSTHVETTKDEVVQLKRYMDALFFDLLEIGQTDQ